MTRNSKTSQNVLLEVQHCRKRTLSQHHKSYNAYVYVTWYTVLLDLSFVNTSLSTSNIWLYDTLKFVIIWLTFQNYMKQFTVSLANWNLFQLQKVNIYVITDVSVNSFSDWFFLCRVVGWVKVHMTHFPLILHVTFLSCLIISSVNCKPYIWRRILDQNALQRVLYFLRLIISKYSF